jgi:ribosomal protein S1
MQTKVTKIMDNGLQVSFGGGLQATIFVDHVKGKLGDYKIGDKQKARVISVDSLQKNCCFSLLDHLVEWKQEFDSDVKVGDQFDSVHLVKSIYGGSW